MVGKTVLIILISLPLTLGACYKKYPLLLKNDDRGRRVEKLNEMLEESLAQLPVSWTYSCGRLLLAMFELKKELLELRSRVTSKIKSTRYYVMLIEGHDLSETTKNIAKSVAKKWKKVFKKLKRIGLESRAIDFGCAMEDQLLKRTFTRRKPLTQKVVLCLFQPSFSKLINGLNRRE
ncbi:unnamed protein product [Cylicocyclus nassatus]|uniref:Uncharacterized protein n=1 Tax=Cylicocyclus nassatus TaxID=53992 RepID=A0AA36DQT7_CYLNA|nr:unnamed protein product [Cylicocyclus nassatus]